VESSTLRAIILLILEHAEANMHELARGGAQGAHLSFARCRERFFIGQMVECWFIGQTVLYKAPFGVYF
jgi:hypothetical protein